MEIPLTRSFSGCYELSDPFELNFTLLLLACLSQRKVRAVLDACMEGKKIMRNCDVVVMISTRDLFEEFGNTF